MKNLILVFAAATLLSATATAQSKVTKDSSVVISDGAGGFRQLQWLEYDNTDKSFNDNYIGDTITAANYLANQVIQDGNVVAERAKDILNIGKDVAKIRTVANQAQSIVGADIFRQIRALYYTEFVDSALTDKPWTWRNGGNTDLQLRLMANGNIRISGLPGISGATRNIDMFGANWIRIQNYPTNSVTYLYRLRRGRWFTIDRALELRMTGINLNSN